MKFISKKFDELTTKELYEIIKARLQIFVVEQEIIYQDLDDYDYNCLHCFILDDNSKVLACLRAYYIDDKTIKIGRVLSIEHGKGLGSVLMSKSLDAIKEKMPCSKACISAQKYAVGFYQKHGFIVTSDDFLEEGIVHVNMELNL